MILHDIRSLLLLQTTITSLVPAQEINRVAVPGIFVGDAIQGFAPPYVVIEEIDTDPMLTLADGTFGLEMVEVDISAYSYSEPGSKRLRRAIRDFFDDYSGVAGSSTIKAVILQPGEISDYEDPKEGRDTKLYFSTVSFLVQYQ